MGKITKHAEFMDTLHNMITKEAAGVAKTTGAGAVTGKPGADTHPVSVSKETEHVDKNKEGRPELNPQEVKQEKSKDKSDPTKKHGEEVPVETAPEKAADNKEAELILPDTKTPAVAKEHADTKITQHESKKASDENSNEKLAQLGQQLLDTINEMQKSGAGTAHTTGAAPVSGIAGQDTHYTSVSKETEHVDKNKAGRPELNPQEVKQEKAHDNSDPTKKHAEELDKEASFELGRQFARAFLSSKTAAVDANIYKEAGRRDFETLIATAAAELEAEDAKKKKHAATPKVSVEKQAEDEEMQIKQAEEAGAQAFYTLLKQAQEEEQANQIKLAFEEKLNAILTEKQAAEEAAKRLANKVAEYEKSIQKQAEEEKLDTKFAQWGGRVVEEVISRLKSETVSK
jgi:hypothetical protein